MPKSIDTLLKKVLKRKVVDNLSMENCRDWDSIRQMQIIMEIEESYNIQFSQNEVVELNSVKKIKKKLKKFL